MSTSVQRTLIRRINSDRAAGIASATEILRQCEVHGVATEPPKPKRKPRARKE